MPDLTYLIGEPGAGKSTLMAHLTRSIPYEELEWPFAHRVYGHVVWELGKRRPDFPGTDALAMNVQPAVLSWLAANKPPLVIAEGDRLGNSSFLNAVVGMGYALHTYVLLGEEAADLHRRLRGSRQDEKWVRGRRTKVFNVAAAFGSTTLPAGAPLSHLEALLVAEKDPVVMELRKRAPQEKRR